MSDKKVKISNILGSQIPDFIQADNPLFKEFLSQYYESEEREYGSTYLSDNIFSTFRPYAKFFPSKPGKKFFLNFL